MVFVSLWARKPGRLRDEWNILSTFYCYHLRISYHPSILNCCNCLLTIESSTVPFNPFFTQLPKKHILSIKWINLPLFLNLFFGFPFALSKIWTPFDLSGLHVSMNSLIWYPVVPFTNGTPGPSGSVPTLLSSEVLLHLGFMHLAHHPQVSTPVLPSWCNLPWPLHINRSQPLTVAIIYCDTLVVSLATWCEELTHLKRPWCWERSKAGGEESDRGWDGWMASPTRWTWVWASFGSWWWTGKPGNLQCMGSQRVRHDWATKLRLFLCCTYPVLWLSIFLPSYLLSLWGQRLGILHKPHQCICTCFSAWTLVGHQ